MKQGRPASHAACARPTAAASCLGSSLLMPLMKPTVPGWQQPLPVARPCGNRLLSTRQAVSSARRRKGAGPNVEPRCQLLQIPDPLGSADAIAALKDQLAQLVQNDEQAEPDGEADAIESG